MIKRILIFFKCSSQRILFSEILKLCLVFQKELLYPHSSQLSIIPTMLPVLHLQFPRHILKTWFLQPVKLCHHDLDDAIAFASSEIKRVFSFYASDSLAGGFVLLFTHLCD